jgi:hypothetical protein
MYSTRQAPVPQRSLNSNGNHGDEQRVHHAPRFHTAADSSSRSRTLFLGCRADICTTNILSPRLRLNLSTTWFLRDRTPVPEIVAATSTPPQHRSSSPRLPSASHLALCIRSLPHGFDSHECITAETIFRYTSSKLRLREVNEADPDTHRGWRG